MHQVESKVAAIGWIVDDLREWRAEVRLVLERIEQQLEGLVKADEVAEAVVTALGRRTRRDFALWQKAIAFVVAAVAVAGGIKGLIA